MHTDAHKHTRRYLLFCHHVQKNVHYVFKASCKNVNEIYLWHIL